MELCKNPRQGMLLLGMPGLSMKEDAMNFASFYLDTTNVLLHPDFLLVEPEKGKKSIGVAAAEELIVKASLRPALAKKQVLVVDGIDLMTVEAQNKILKLLEDIESVLVVAISYGGPVLDTVRSRMSVVEYKPLCKNDFISALNDTEYLTDAEMYFYLTNGCPGQCTELSSRIEMFKDARNAILNGKLEDLLPAFHLLLEKDKEAITGTAYVPNALQFMESVFFSTLEKGAKKEHVVACIELINKHKAECKKVTYTKDNFFQLIVDLMEVK